MTKTPTPGEEGMFGAGESTAGDWSYAHDLVGVYLGIAQLADSQLDPEEQRTFMRKFGQWMPEISLDQFQEIWGEVTTVYGQLGSTETRYAFYLQSVINVSQYMGGHRDNLKSIVRDLVDIAGADGVLHENEVTMIKAAAISYGLSADLRVNVKTGQVELTLKEAN